MATERLNRDSLDGLGVCSLMITAMALPTRRPQAAARGREGRETWPDRVAGAWRRFLAGVDRWFWEMHQRETEAYLAQSRDVFELEARMRDLERRQPPFFG